MSTVKRQLQQRRLPSTNASSWHVDASRGSKCVGGDRRAGGMICQDFRMCENSPNLGPRRQVVLTTSCFTSVGAFKPDLTLLHPHSRSLTLTEQRVYLQVDNGSLERKRFDINLAFNALTLPRWSTPTFGKNYWGLRRSSGPRDRTTAGGMQVLPCSDLLNTENHALTYTEARIALLTLSLHNHSKHNGD
jgi:hypothetical protein